MFHKDIVVGHNWLLKLGDGRNVYGSLQIRVRRRSFWGLSNRWYTLDLVRAREDNNWINSETGEKVPTLIENYIFAALKKERVYDEAQTLPYWSAIEDLQTAVTRQQNKLLLEDKGDDS